MSACPHGCPPLFCSHWAPPFTEPSESDEQRKARIAKAIESARAFGLVTREGDETYGERPEEATMSERLTDEDLAKLERLHEAGSAAPWTSNRGYEQQDPGVYVCPGDSGVIIACEDQGPSEADADLMVAARNALPELLREVRRLRVERDRATTQAERAVELRDATERDAHAALRFLLRERFGEREEFHACEYCDELATVHMRVWRIGAFNAHYCCAHHAEETRRTTPRDDISYDGPCEHSEELKAAHAFARGK